MNIHPGFIGIDVSKLFLDIYQTGFGFLRIDNTAEAIGGQLARWRADGVFVLFEATGRYDVRLRRALTQHGIAYARVNPMRARDFARAAGYLAKTDRIDARMLAAMAQCLSPQPDAGHDEGREQLAMAHKRRDQLVHIRQQERTRRCDCTEPAILADLQSHLAELDARIDAWDVTIHRLLAQSRALADASRRLRSIPGVGPVTVATLLALMPELGSMTPKKIAAIAGLAPFNVDSGQHRGARKIKGGRKRVRDALYMAAVSASRHSPRFKAFYQHLRDAGKPAKLAFIAVARKLLLAANAIMRDKTVFQT